MGRYLVAALVLFQVSSAFAMDGCGAGPCAKCHSLSLKEANELLRAVGEVKKVEVSPVNGLWLLDLEKDGRKGVAFLDFGKKHLIAGTVFPLAPEKQAASAAPRSAPDQPAAARFDVEAVPRDNSYLMGNPNGAKKLFVFTDPDCPFCRKLHAELKKVVASEPDIAVYIKFYPLQMHPAAYDKARVLLGRNSPELLDDAFAGRQLPPPGEQDRREPVESTIKFAQTAGITSTPTLVFPDGRILAGFRDAEEIRRLLVTATGNGGK